MNSEWPESIIQDVLRIVGPQPEISPAGGMSGASTYRLRGRHASAILKRSDNQREWFIYSRLGHAFREHDITIPELYAHSRDGSSWWILIEDVPHPFPHERFPADHDVIAMLRRLHALPVSLLDDLPDPYMPEWTRELSRQALSLFAQPERDKLAAQVEEVRQQSQHLFTRASIVSGDPNPANWGMREDGTPVLFDWERCTVASPAIDLGIIVPGPGSNAAFQAVSHAYAGNLDLAPDIAAAKLWSVIEFLAGYASGEIAPAFDIAAFINRVPSWIANEFQVS